MAKLSIAPGSTSVSLLLFIQDSASTTGAGKTGLAYNTGSLTCYYVRPGAAAAAVSLVTQTVTGAWSSGGFVEVDSTNLPGVYRFDVPNAVLAAGVRSAVVMLKGASGVAPLVLEVDLNAEVSLVSILGTALTETSGQIAAAFKKFFDKASPTGTVNSLPDAVAGASGGVAIVGSVMGKIPATLAAGDVTGNLPTDLQTIKTQTVTASAPVTFPGTIGTSTYAGADTSGTTELLTRIPDATAGTAGGLPTVDANNYIAGMQGAKNKLDDLTDAPAGPSVADIKTALEVNGSKLDHLWEMTEDNGDVRRLTANALELAPTGGGGTSDWTADEREQIRYRLQIDGTQTAPSDSDLPAVNVTYSAGVALAGPLATEEYIDAALLALQGAGGDTLETLSDQISGVQASSGLTAQETANAVHNLAPVGTPATGSIGDHLDDLATALAAATFALTIVSAIDGGEITIYQAVSFQATISGLAIPAGWTKVYFTVKRATSEADTDAILQMVETNPSAGTDGLLRLNGAAGTAANGSLTVDQAGGTVVIDLVDDVTDDLALATGPVWSLKAIATSASTLLATGTLNVLGQATAAVA